MSVSISAAPFFLIAALGKGIIDVTGAVVQGISSTGGERIHLEGKDLEEIFNKAFQTVIVDKNALIKTLKEHGAKGISDKNGQISCNCEAFHLTFEKLTKDASYTMTATYNKDHGLNDLVENIGSEYALNAQEISYNKIKERLEAQNLEITDEEVFDDNTIVLTVDLD